MRTNLRRQERNRAAKAALRTTLKEIETSIANKDAAAVQSSLASAVSVIGKTAKKGSIHKNKAARKESRLQRKVNQLVAGQKSQG